MQLRLTVDTNFFAELTQRLWKSSSEVVRELVQNSFPYDEPIMIKEGGRISITRIGEFVERQMKNEEEGALLEEVGEESYYKKLSTGLEVLTIDESLNLSFKPLTAVFKHRSPSELTEIDLGPGRTVTTTLSHNVFLLNENCEISCEETRALKQGRRVITAAPQHPMTFLRLRELDLVNELLSLPAQETQGIVVHGAAQHHPLKVPKRQQVLLALSSSAGGSQVVTWRELYDSMASVGLMDPNGDIQSLRRQNYLETVGKGQHRIREGLQLRNYYSIPRDWVQCDSVPLNELRKGYPGDARHEDDGLTISVKQGKTRLPAKLRLSEGLMSILGYYSSEGYISEGRDSVFFSFGRHELDTHIKHLVEAIRKVFGIEPAVRFPHATAVNVVIDDSTIAFLFDKVFKTGSCASDKRVPWLIFNVSSKLAEEYLNAYIRGDGHVQNVKRNRKTTVATVSADLFTDLKFLLTVQARSFTAEVKECERTIMGNLTPCKRAFLIYIRHRDRTKAQHIPVNSSRERMRIPSHYSAPDLCRSTILKLSRRGYRIPEAPLRVAKSDVGNLKIRELRRVPATSEWVYDISVAGVERFVGGEAIALLHNSYDADASRVIVSFIPDRLVIDDDGGMDANRIRSFLQVGGSHQETEFTPSGRRVVGKYRVGRLSALGSFRKMQVRTRLHNYHVSFEFSAEDLQRLAQGTVSIRETGRPALSRNGTEISLVEPTVRMKSDQVKMILMQQPILRTPGFEVFVRRAETFRQWNLRGAQRVLPREIPGIKLPVRIKRPLAIHGVLTIAADGALPLAEEDRGVGIVASSNLVSRSLFGFEDSPYRFDRITGYVECNQLKSTFGAKDRVVEDENYRLFNEQMRRFLLRKVVPALRDAEFRHVGRLEMKTLRRIDRMLGETLVKVAGDLLPNQPLPPGTLKRLGPAVIGRTKETTVLLVTQKSGDSSHLQPVQKLGSQRTADTRPADGHARPFHGGRGGTDGERRVGHYLHDVGIAVFIYEDRADERPSYNDPNFSIEGIAIKAVFINKLHPSYVKCEKMGGLVNHLVTLIAHELVAIGNQETLPTVQLINKIYGTALA